MNRITHVARLAVALISISAMAQSSVPGLTVSIYAVQPKKAPLRITNFRYREGSIDLVVRNESAEAITDFSVFAWVAAPPGCSGDEASTGKAPRDSIQTGEIYLMIRPHETVTLTPQHQDLPLSPPTLVSSAQSWKYAYLHVQTVIGTVHFADGGTWSPGVPETNKNSGEALDPRLVDLDSQACSSIDTPTILAGLKAISGAGFKSRDRTVIDTAKLPGSHLTIPHLLFRCSLDGTGAYCPWN